MHYCLLVIEEAKLDQTRANTVIQHVKGLGGPDWCQIGGRWSGLLDSDYDPAQDPRNREDKCWLCQGTGKRPDMEVADGCNGCQGKGWKVKWPTQWVDVPGNYMLAAELLDRIDADPEYAKRVLPWGFVIGGRAYVVDSYPGQPSWSTFSRDRQDGWREQYSKWEEEAYADLARRLNDALAQAAARDYYVTVVDIHS